MQIRMYHDLEEIKPGGLKRLRKRQIMAVAGTLLVSVPAILLLIFVCRLNISIACYMGILPAIPMCYVGMFRKYGMTYMEYKRTKRQLETEYEYQTRRYEGKGKKHEDQK